jgi:uncharacterized membrane protein HdeD (DUF308 family)
MLKLVFIVGYLLIIAGVLASVLNLAAALITQLIVLGVLLVIGGTYFKYRR